MGIAKDDGILCAERGYGHCDKKVCRDCVGNRQLKELIKNKGYMGRCDYCGQRRKVVELEALFELIISGIKFSYESADDYLFEGKYLVETYDRYDVAHDIADEAEIENQDLIDDIVNTLADETWCKKDAFYESDHERYLISWHEFCELVKWKMRYVFFRSREEEFEFDEISPAGILDMVGMFVEELGLVRQKPERTQLFRGRTHYENEALNEAKQFGPPPVEYAAANRMSPEGIPMFYATFEAETALDEINDSKPCATVARFLTSRALTVVDLSVLKRKKLPSIFDEKNRDLRQALIFLKRFAEEISMKTEGKPAIDYVPTQIVTEYFRHVFRYGDNKAIDGIIYSSAAREGGHCAVLFMDGKDFENSAKCMVNKEHMSLKLYKKNYVES